MATGSYDTTWSTTAASPTSVLTLPMVATVNTELAGVAQLTFSSDYSGSASKTGSYDTEWSVGAEPALTAPAAAASAIHEAQGKRRSQAEISGEWGTGRQYTRFLKCAWGDLPTVRSSVLYLGSDMDDNWHYTTVSHGLEGPKCQSVSIDKTSDAHWAVLVATFDELDVEGSRSSGYMRTNRINPAGKDQYGDTVVEWGIAPTSTSYSIPEEGDYLGGNTTRTTARCVEVQIMENQSHGRVMVRSVWRTMRTYTMEGAPDNGTQGDSDNVSIAAG